MLLLSLLSWGFLCWYSHNHPIKCSSSERGGGGGGETTVTSHTYYYYKVKFPHNSIDPSQSITFYDAYGTVLYTLPPYYEHMDYGAGVVSVPGASQNSQVESVSTATYYVYYASDDLVIDYDNAEFKIAKKLIKTPAQTVVKATYEYLSVVTPFKDVASVIDGRWDTQVQTEFVAEPPTGYNYGIIDLGSTKTIQAMDVVSGFYKPDPDGSRKFDVDFNITLQYSLDGTNYYEISDKTHNVHFTGGQAESFEEEDLGVGFTARYLKLILENVKKIEYGSVTATVSGDNRADLISRGYMTDAVSNGTIIVIKSGTYVVALTEIAAYDNIVLKSEATLIPYTTLTQAIDVSGLPSGSFPTTITVATTNGFSTPSSTELETAYLLKSDGTYDVFTYTGTTATQFTGVAGLSQSHAIGTEVVQTIAGDLTYYDYNNLRKKLGDRIYKSNKVSDEQLFSQAQLDYVAKEFLKEFVKNHSKVQVEVLYAPHILVGDTITVNDAYNSTSTRYFVDSIKDNNGFYSLVLARYPS